MAFPPVVLDTTLSDLFAEQHERAVLAYCATDDLPPILPSIPHSQKFIYSGLPLVEGDAVGLVLRCKGYPQHLGFIAGNIPIYFLEYPETPAASLKTFCYEFERVYDALREDQRPETHRIKHPSKLSLPENAGIVTVRSQDSLAHLPSLVDPEVQYDLSSKRALAISGIPTPKTEIIDSILSPDQVLDKDTIGKEVARLISKAQVWEPPFILKLQYSAASGGTFVVRSKEDWDNCVCTVTDELHLILRQLNRENHGFQPASLLLQEFIPGESIGISFFVTKEGTAIFLGACGQLFGEDKLWIGASISYKEQDRIYRENKSILDCTARYAHAQGYFGPFGIDVMRDKNGEPLVIDLNPRSTGATPLCLLRQHLSVKRGLHEATLLMPILLDVKWAEFTDVFRDELFSGQLIVTSWNQVPEKRYSVAGVVIAAETKAGLQAGILKVKTFNVNE
ncbi:hypothetical protein ASPVEDRAFT_35118 [Aspergillus versicolor CBS 583.65]|uniref:ATP-grasp domain-containing protein n=1 Tax=Aspergillus versicolor CBS 583.65 TaxID=1036611 RepID=A0A1L9P2R9_ASPVE|nr:uncharacterized protein ASPVEDRAFT_35118 [Aspergillus versicolor CBS 583.65]OJI95796.1 hypothetical protein ASPVEDRAFT_35118 [Aspergillus versicolor CBS 583.65]